MLYKDYLYCLDEVQEQLKVLAAKKVGTLRAARRNLEAAYRQTEQIRTALIALGYMPTRGTLMRL